MGNARPRESRPFSGVGGVSGRSPGWFSFDFFKFIKMVTKFIIEDDVLMAEDGLRWDYGANIVALSAEQNGGKVFLSGDFL